ncbi:MAG: hypothetical protein AAFV93_06255 [Chloroflexota bacterium]
MVSSTAKPALTLANYTSTGSEGILFLVVVHFGHPKWVVVTASTHLLTSGCSNYTPFVHFSQMRF